MRVLDLFSGIGGFSLGLERAGFETVAFCEIEPYPRKVLAKHWPKVPIYDDVRRLTAKRLADDGITGIDVITGGFPCQDISVAGKQAGIGEGTRSGLWSEIARLIGELRPRYAVLENVTALLSGGTEQRHPFNKCVCGWPYRWRGLHLHNAQQESEHLHSEDRCRDVNKSGADISSPAIFGRKGERNAQSDQRMGGGEMLVSNWRRGDQCIGMDLPSLDFEKAAGRILSSLENDAERVREAYERECQMDTESQGGVFTDETGNICAESEGAEFAGGEQDCESCGRPVVYESGRPRRSKWFNRILGDLAEIGYDAEWHCIPASELGAHHHRDRVWIIAYPNGERCQKHGSISVTDQPDQLSRECHANDAYSEGQRWDRPGPEAHQSGGTPESSTKGGGILADTLSQRRQGQGQSIQWSGEAPRINRQAVDAFAGSLGEIWRTESQLGRVVDGIPHRAHRLKGLGNAVVPQIPELIGRAIMEYERTCSPKRHVAK